MKFLITRRVRGIEISTIDLVDYWGGEERIATVGSEFSMSFD